MDDDKEFRASNFLDAMDALTDLFGGQVEGGCLITPEGTCALLNILSREAKAVMPESVHVRRPVASND